MNEHKCITIDDQAESIVSQAVLLGVLEAQKTNHSPPFDELCQMNKEYKARPSEKAKPPKGRAVALSTTCQELFVVSDGCQDNVQDS